MGKFVTDRPTQILSTKEITLRKCTMFDPGIQGVTFVDQNVQRNLKSNCIQKNGLNYALKLWAQD